MSVKLAGRPDNLEQVYGNFVYNQLFVKNFVKSKKFSQLREEKCHRSQLLQFIFSWKSFLSGCLAVGLTSHTYQNNTLGSRQIYWAFLWIMFIYVHLCSPMYVHVCTSM